VFRLRHSLEDDEEEDMKVTLVAVLDMDIEPPECIGPELNVVMLKQTMADAIKEKLEGDLTVNAIHRRELWQKQ
jgi:hypothetical protein